MVEEIKSSKQGNFCCNSVNNLGIGCGDNLGGSYGAKKSGAFGGFL